MSSVIHYLNLPEDIINIILDFYIDKNTGYPFFYLIYHKNNLKFEKALIKTELHEWSSYDVSVCWLRGSKSMYQGAFRNRKEFSKKIRFYLLKN